MRVIAEDLTVYEVEGIVDRWKDRAARDGHVQGLKHGSIAATIVLTLLAGLFWTAGVVSFHARPVPSEPGLPPGAVPLGTPAAPLSGQITTGTVPPLPASNAAPGSTQHGGSIAPAGRDPRDVKSPTNTLRPAPPPDASKKP